MLANLKQYKILNLILFSLVLFTFSMSNAAVLLQKNTVSNKDRSKKITLGFDLGGTHISTSRDKTSGALFNMDIKYALNDKWAIYFQAAQAYDMDGYENIYTSMALKASYSIYGSQIRSGKSVNVSEYNVVTSTKYQRPALYMDLGVKQVFFNGSVRALPLIGPALNINYQFGSSQKIGYRIGAGIDYLSNNEDENVSPYNFFAGILYWL